MYRLFIIRLSLLLYIRINTQFKQSYIVVLQTHFFNITLIIVIPTPRLAIILSFYYYILVVSSLLASVTRT